MKTTSPIAMDGAFYRQFAGLLLEELPDYSAAEIQGMLTGLTCIGVTEAQYDAWRPILTGEEGSSRDSKRLRDALSGLMALIEKSLKGQDFSFRPLLPPDSDTISDRTQALGDWCYGFGVGLHWSGTLDAEHLEPDAKDAIDDIAELAHVDPDSADSDDEKALAELEEYLRIATQLIFESTGLSETHLKSH